MRLLVKKDFKGLIVGDILEYNTVSDVYEVEKEDSVISDNTTITRNSIIRVNEYIARRMSDYFDFIDNDGNKIDIISIRYQDMPAEFREQEEKVNDTYITRLKKEISSLQHEVKTYETTVEDLIVKNENLYSRNEYLREKYNILEGKINNVYNIFSE